MVVQQNSKDEKIDEILEELNEVLDKITDSKVDDDFSVEITKKELFSKFSIEENSSGEKSYVVHNKKFLETDNNKKTQEQNTRQNQLVDEEKNTIEIKAGLFHPSFVEGIKDKFFGNINSALKKICKKQIKIVPSLCLVYHSLEKDIILSFEQILKDLKNKGIEVVFFIVSDGISLSFLEEDFIKNISNYFLLTKIINYKDLNLKFIYLDISIDLLLVLK